MAWCLLCSLVSSRCERRWKADLKLRIVQHNIRTVASYYKQINTKRLAELLGLDEAQAERNVAGTYVIPPYIAHTYIYIYIRTTYHTPDSESVPTL